MSADQVFFPRIFHENNNNDDDERLGFPLVEGDHDEFSGENSGDDERFNEFSGENSSDDERFNEFSGENSSDDEIVNEFSGENSSDDDESVVSDCESVVTGNSVKKTVKETGNGLVKVNEGDRLHGIITSKFVAKMREIGLRGEVECVYRNMFNASMVSKAKVGCFQIYVKAVGAKNGGECKVKYGWFGGCSKEEIERIVEHGFGHGDVGNCGGFGNAVVLNADHSPRESVESAVADGDGVKHILLCRVLLGKTEVVNRFSTQCHPSSEEFDSGVDDAVSPKKYIIWSSQMNTHILPEFVISFKTQRIVNRPQVNGVGRAKPVSPWIPIPELIANLSKMLPPKSIKEITQYRHKYIGRKISRNDMIRGIREVTGDRILLTVLKDFSEKKGANLSGWMYNQVK